MMQRAADDVAAALRNSRINLRLLASGYITFMQASKLVLEILEEKYDRIRMAVLNRMKKQMTQILTSAVESGHYEHHDGKPLITKGSSKWILLPPILQSMCGTTMSLIELETIMRGMIPETAIVPVLRETEETRQRHNAD